MDAYMDGRSTKTILFDRGVHKYVIVTAIMIFDQVYVTDHNFVMNKRIGLGYLHSYNSGQDQYIYHTNSLRAYIS